MRKDVLVEWVGLMVKKSIRHFGSCVVGRFWLVIGHRK
jgi:hypothetical protein